MTDSPYQVLLYYLYTSIDDPAAYLAHHRSLCQNLALKGRILIGREGINGTLSGTVAATQRYMDTLRADPVTSAIEFKLDPAPAHCFPKLSIKLRKEIVSLGLGADDLDPNQITGHRLSPAAWQAMLESDQDYILLDCRNQYESAIGHFQGAICPDLEHFRDFPQWIRDNLADAKDKKVLTYCTGGIRCEKLSGFLVREGFQDVSQLHGGIVNYSQDPTTQGNHFDGLCYVFDERIGVEANFTASRKLISHCEKCGVQSARYRNCAYPPCNRQHFLCESCEEISGRFCRPACESAHTATSTEAF